jgi:hypothetical protein
MVFSVWKVLRNSLVGWWGSEKRAKTVTLRSLGEELVKETVQGVERKEKGSPGYCSHQAEGKR